MAERGVYGIHIEIFKSGRDATIGSSSCGELFEFAVHWPTYMLLKITGTMPGTVTPKQLAWEIRRIGGCGSAKDIRSTLNFAKTARRKEVKI